MKKAILFIFVNLCASIAFSCACTSYESNFYKNIKNNSFVCIAIFDTMSQDNLEGRYKRSISRLKVLETIGTFPRKAGETILVAGTTGFDCNGELPNYKKGDTCILNLEYLRPHSYPPPQIPQRDTFTTFGCGTYHLDIKNGKNNGLNLEEIKYKINRVRALQTDQCICKEEYDFYKNISQETTTFMLEYQSFDYAYSHNDMPAQTGYFKVIKSLSNKNNKEGDTIVVLGEDGINCGESFENFTSGDTFFLALKDGYYKAFEKDTFYLVAQFCNNYQLKIKNVKHSGLSVDEIVQKINLIASVDHSEIASSISIYPNPVNEKLDLNSENFLLENISIFSTTGVKLLEFKDINKKTTSIDLSTLSPGIYTILIQNEGGFKQEKIQKR